MDILYVLDISCCQGPFKVDYREQFDYRVTMPSDIKKILFSISKDLLKRVDDFRFDNHLLGGGLCIVPGLCRNQGANRKGQADGKACGHQSRAPGL